MGKQPDVKDPRICVACGVASTEARQTFSLFGEPWRHAVCPEISVALYQDPRDGTPPKVVAEVNLGTPRVNPETARRCRVCNKTGTPEYHIRLDPDCPGREFSWIHVGICPTSGRDPQPTKPTETVLEEAERLIGGARRTEYGGVRESFERIAALWSVRIGKTLTARDVADLMILLKVARAMGGPKRDSYVDIAGYARCVEQLGDLVP